MMVLRERASHSPIIFVLPRAKTKLTMFRFKGLVKRIGSFARLRAAQPRCGRVRPRRNPAALKINVIRNTSEAAAGNLPGSLDQLRNLARRHGRWLRRHCGKLLDRRMD